MQILLLPIIILNLLAGLVGGVWLLFYGEWMAVTAAVISGIVSPYLLSLLIAPSSLLISPLVKLEESGYKGYAFILCMLSLAYTYAILGAWCIIIFEIALRLFQDHGNSNNIMTYIPYMLIGYSVATSPLETMANADSKMGLYESGISSLFFCITSGIVFFVGFSGISIWGLISMYGVTIFILLLGMGYLTWTRIC